MNASRRLCRSCFQVYGCVVDNVIIFCQWCRLDGECPVKRNSQVKEETGSCPVCRKKEVGYVRLSRNKRF